jgi:rhodanese-related sulfurtransferase
MQPADVSEKRDSLLIVDVREFYEFDAGHIEGAVHIPLRQLPISYEDLAKDRPVVVACQIGQRSALAADFLRERGWDAHNLEGGMEAWAAAGLPFVTNEQASGTVVDGWAQTFEDWDK